jgi:transposase-like protein
MKKTKIEEGKICPKCGHADEQVNRGRNRSGTRRCYCKHCKIMYTLEPKKREYSEEVREQAIKTYYAGASGRGVGKVFGFNKANVYNWIKKNGSDKEN